MRAIWLALPVVALWGQTRVEPSMTSLHPFTLHPGSSMTASIRGAGLHGASGAWTATPGIRITPEGVAKDSEKNSVDVVRVRIEADAAAKPGRHPFRLIAANGVSNALPLHIVDLPTTPEPEGSHESVDAAVKVEATPALFNGRLSRRGEADYYVFEAKAGETLTFEVLSGLPQIASGGSAATIANFDPSLTIYEFSGSWFDPKRLRRIAYNDEPVFVFGKSTDAHLVHRFAKGGTYVLRIEAFAGQGGPDYGYQLKIVPGERPPDQPAPRTGWEERSYTRKLSANRLNELAERGGAAKGRPAIENYRMSPDDAPVFPLPGTLTGELTRPGETHRARFKIDGPTDIAMEIETPEAAPPFFNPLVRLLNEGGEETATNLFAGKGACSGALTKSPQAKTIIPLREAGTYTLELRDATSDLGGPGFRYKLQVRPQVPHLGNVAIESDRINLTPSEAKTFRVTFDREEGYRGAVSVTAESLPDGVQFSVGADFEPDKDPPPSEGKRERYVPRQERAVIVLSASADALPMKEPRMATIVVRPVAEGRLGEVVARRQVPVMVVRKP